MTNQQCKYYLIDLVETQLNIFKSNIKLREDLTNILRYLEQH